MNPFKKLENSCLINTRGYMQRYKDQGTACKRPTLSGI